MGYKVAQICLNGHVIIGDTDYADLTAPFCSKCGAKTISHCPKCHAPIRGDYCQSQAVSVLSKAPSYCHNCGEPYAWTESSLSAASELIDEAKALTAEEKTKFKALLSEIISDNPRTTLAATRIAKYLGKLVPTAQETFKQIFYRLAADGAKALIWSV